MTANEIMLNSLLGKWFMKAWPIDRQNEIYLYAQELHYKGMMMIAYKKKTGKFQRQHWEKLPSFRCLELVENEKLIKKLNAKKAVFILRESNKDETEENRY